jgi:predicted alpha/beta superfamily hydrolase
MGIRSQLLYALVFAAGSNAFACESSVVGRLDLRTLDAKVFPYPHGLRIWLPPGYDVPANGAKHYPVLYLLDGQNLFDRCTSSFGSEWQVDETITRLVASGKMPPVIVVGLDHAGDKRAQEYLPEDDPTSPGARNTKGRLFPKYLSQDVMPYVAAHYRVATGPGNTAVGGSSYGAIAALNIAIHEPSLASRILVESPSLQVANGAVLREAVSLVGPSTRIAIGMGDEETRKEAIDRTLLASARVLATNLAGSAARPAVQLTIGAGDHHQEQAWSRRLPEALVFLYGSDAGNMQPLGPVRPR